MKNCDKCNGTGYYQYSTRGTPHSKICEDCCKHEGEPWKADYKWWCKAGCGKEMPAPQEQGKCVVEGCNKEEHKNNCCRWCCNKKHDHIECTDGSRCHCTCHKKEQDLDKRFDDITEASKLSFWDSKLNLNDQAELTFFTKAARDEAYERGKNEGFDKACLLYQKAPHTTEYGACCACEYDTAVAEEAINRAHGRGLEEGLEDGIHAERFRIESLIGGMRKYDNAQDDQSVDDSVYHEQQRNIGFNAALSAVLEAIKGKQL